MLVQREPIQAKLNICINHKFNGFEYIVSLVQFQPSNLSAKLANHKRNVAENKVINERNINLQ